METLPESELNDILESVEFVNDADLSDFELPVVAGQSLEEILNEEVSYIETDDDAGLSETAEFQLDGVASVSDLSSVPTSIRSISKDWRRPQRVKVKSDMLNMSKLRGVSAQLRSASERAHVGAPTALCVQQQTVSADPKTGARLLAVGTSHGALLVFELNKGAESADNRQTLKFCLGSARSAADAAKRARELGAVSALAFSPRGRKLLVGYAKGHVQLVDAVAGRALVSLRPEQAHQIGRGVLALAFTDNPSVVVCLDSGGSLFGLRFVSSIVGTSVKLNCVFSGCHGEVCSIAALTVPPQQRAKPLGRLYADSLLVAMASLTKVLVIRLRAPLKVVCAAALPGDAADPPLVAWQWAPIQLDAAVRVVEPVVAVCRGARVCFFHVSTTDGDAWTVVPLQTVQVDCSPVNVQWLNSRCVAVVDASEHLRVFEVGSAAATDAIAETSLADVGLVYASADFKGHATGGNVSPALVCLAERACYQSVVADRDGRVYLLGVSGVFTISLRRWLDRIEHLRSAHEFAAALQLALDFYTGKQKLGIWTSARGAELSKSVIGARAAELVCELAQNASLPDRGSVVQLTDRYKELIPICVEAAVQLSDWPLLYDSLYEQFSRDPLAKGLFLECLEERLLDGALPGVPPALVQDYLNHLTTEGMLGAVESSVVRLPVDCLDLHQVMTLCRSHRLFDGIIYVFNKALKDFTSPLQEMLALLRQVTDGHELLSDEDIRVGNKILLYLSCCLCGRAYPVDALPPTVAKSVLSDVYAIVMAHDGQKSPPFPNLHLLLRFDTREFLNVLTMAFQSPLFADQNGQSLVQSMVDALVSVFIGEDSDSALEIGAFLTFISRLLADREQTLTIGRAGFHRLLAAALEADAESIGSTRCEERTQALLQLLHTQLGQRLVDARLVLSWAERGNYFQVCEHLYRQQRDFDKVLDCYLNDPYRQSTVFALIRSMLSGAELLKSEQLALRRRIMLNIEPLAKVDMVQCADMLLHLLPELLTQLSAKVNNEAVLRQLLGSLFDSAARSGERSLSGDGATDLQLVEQYVALLCGDGAAAHTRLAAFVRRWDALCSEHDGVLRLCRRFNQVAALVYLLERRGAHAQVVGVFDEALRAQTAATQLRADDFVRIGRQAVDFSQRLSSRFSEERRREIWFGLLDRLLELPPEQILHNADVKDLLSETVNSMINYVPADEAVERLFSHAAFAQGTYAEHKGFIGAVIRGYEYEQVLFDKVVNSLFSDVHRALARERRHLQRALAVASVECAACAEPLAAAAASALTFALRPSRLRSLSTAVFQLFALRTCLVCSGVLRLNGLPQQAKSAEQRSNKIGLTPPLLAPCSYLDVVPDDSNPFSEDDTLFTSSEFSLRIVPPRSTSGV